MQLIKEIDRHGQYAMNNKLCEDTRKQRNKENYYFHSNNKFLSNYWSVNRNAGLHSYGWKHSNITIYKIIYHTELTRRLMYLIFHFQVVQVINQKFIENIKKQILIGLLNSKNFLDENRFLLVISFLYSHDMPKSYIYFKY